MDLDLGPREGKRLIRRSLWPASLERAAVGMERMKRQTNIYEGRSR